MCVEVKNISKRFKTVSYGTSFIKGVMGRFSSARQPNFLWALKDISFSVGKGEVFGIIGPNGSGKTTLVKIIAGILRPTEGKVIVDGQVMPFLQLASVFHPDLTGKENVYLYGALLGMFPREIKSKFEQIIDFAGVHGFVDTVVRHYSSGMRAKLAFSTAIQVQSETLIVDEALSAGDISFQERCVDVFKQFKAEGKTIILVSNDLYGISQYCQRALLLKEGRQIMVGDSKSVVERYRDLSA